MGGSTADEDATMLAVAKVMVAFSVQATAAVEGRVSPAQLRTLTVLDELGDANLGELADRLGIVASATSRLCERLVDAGLVTRGPSPRSRREVLLRITANGRAVLAEVNALRLERLRATLDRLPAARRGTVVRALRSFADAADAVVWGENEADNDVAAVADGTWGTPPPTARRPRLR
ncbi:MarR family winged helix-turn-helix transcriptional regulator [Amycolatopsis nigrescens]|uniref:MarR family winged helix-turn-helix transcriptional regulator n=1 Tax=Amycolatopsis nigrescens TaxID=381445 RepID=UPI0003684896|nr:MarR family transcriptional regulator [Amycolatopsis nigrescens]